MPARRVCILLATAFFACKAADSHSPLLDLANRLYLDGEWEWADTMSYEGYVPSGEDVPHYGYYIIAGTASLEPLDSAGTEEYTLTALATLFHVDSVGAEERELWTVPDIEYQDTVRIQNDTIFNLAIEPIPPQANPNTNLVRWVLNDEQLWCRNWLTDTIPAGNTEGCRTTITWRRTVPRQ